MVLSVAVGHEESDGGLATVASSQSDDSDIDEGGRSESADSDANSDDSDDSGDSDENSDDSGDSDDSNDSGDSDEDDESVGVICTELAFIAQKCDVAELERWHETGMLDDINARDNSGLTLLARCLESGTNTRSKKLDFVRSLLSLGASVKKVCDGETPLCAAAGQYPNLVDSREACEIVKLLLDHGADVNHRTEDGWTALMSTADRGNVDIMRTLLSRGADPWLRLSPYTNRIVTREADAREIALDTAEEEELPIFFFPGQNIRMSDEELEERQRENRERRLPWDTCAALLADVQSEGGWARYARRPRSRLLALRALCERGRATPPKGILARLFPNAPPPERRSRRLNAISRPLPKEVFWTILAYWRSDRDAY